MEHPLQPVPAAPRDKATAYSLQFIEALEKYLHLERVDDDVTGDPVSVNEFTIQRLGGALHELLEKNVVLDAISGVESYRKIQSAGFGYAEDFKAFTRVGLLLADRVVLWEGMVAGLLSDPSGVDVGELVTLAIRLAELKGAVEEGAIVIVPHPQFWLPHFQYHAPALRQAMAQMPPDVANEMRGLMNALSVTEEGFRVHPYSWQSDPGRISRVRHWLKLGQEDMERAKERIREGDQDELTLGLQQLVRHRFAPFLADVSLRYFCRATRGRRFRDALQDALAGLPGRPYEPELTDQQRHQRLHDLVVGVAFGLRETDNAIRDHAAELKVKAAGTAVGAVRMAQQLFAPLEGPMAIADIASMIGGSSSFALGFRSLMKHRGDRPKRTMIYQVFARLRDEAEHEEALRQLPEFRGLVDPP